MCLCTGGTYWGEMGWLRYVIRQNYLYITIIGGHLILNTRKLLIFVFRIVRGTNNLGVESDCDWAVPAKL